MNGGEGEGNEHEQNKLLEQEEGSALWYKQFMCISK
jgi:hypothetical protein